MVEIELDISLENSRKTMLMKLIVWMMTMSSLSCGYNLNYRIEQTNLPEQTATPVIEIKSNSESNLRADQDAVSDNNSSKVAKLKCIDAEKVDDQLLCNAVIPVELREDRFFMDSFEITFCEIDLNDDGANELIVWESSWAGTSGGSMYVLNRSRQGYKMLYETGMTWTPIILLQSTHHGWKDFAYFQAGGGVKPSYVAVVHNQKVYTTVGGPKLSDDQPTGHTLIEKNWDSSVFGPSYVK